MVNLGLARRTSKSTLQAYSWCVCVGGGGVVVVGRLFYIFLSSFLAFLTKVLVVYFMHPSRLELGQG